MPPTKNSATFLATANASLVFPAPPAPVKLISRRFGSSNSFAAWSTSLSRPTREVRGIGRSKRLVDSFSTAAFSSCGGAGSPVQSGAEVACFDWVTAEAKRYPRRGIVLMICCSGSHNARRSSTVHCTNESSVTKLSGQIARASSSLPISLPEFSTRYLSASKTFGRSFTSWPDRDRLPRARSSVNSPKQYVLWPVSKVFHLFRTGFIAREFSRISCFFRQSFVTLAAGVATLDNIGWTNHAAALHAKHRATGPVGADFNKPKRTRRQTRQMNSSAQKEDHNDNRTGARSRHEQAQHLHRSVCNRPRRFGSRRDGSDRRKIGTI